MRFYDARAICKDGEKTIDMFTYDASTSLENALRNINKWNEIYWVQKAWINVSDTDDPNFGQTLIVAFGQVKEETDA